MQTNWLNLVCKQEPATALLSNGSLTENYEKADKDGGKGSHTQSQDLFLLHQLTVGAREAAWAEASVPIGIVPIDTSAPVSARVIQALVPVLAALAVSCHSLTSRAPVSREGQVSGVSRVISQEAETVSEGKRFSSLWLFYR